MVKSPLKRQCCKKLLKIGWRINNLKWTPIWKNLYPRKPNVLSVRVWVNWHVISWVQSGRKALFKLIKSTVLVQLASAVFWQEGEGWSHGRFTIFYTLPDLLHIALLPGACEFVFILLANPLYLPYPVLANFPLLVYWECKALSRLYTKSKLHEIELKWSYFHRFSNTWFLIFWWYLGRLL